MFRKKEDARKSQGKELMGGKRREKEKKTWGKTRAPGEANKKVEHGSVWGIRRDD